MSQELFSDPSEEEQKSCERKSKKKQLRQENVVEACNII